MSQKRRYEEYHDPDYPQPGVADAKRLRAGEETGGTGTNGGEVAAGSEVDKSDRIRAIVRREFERELGLKEQELNRIEHKLIQAKRLLQRVRYAVVFSFYSKKNLEYSESELRNELTLASTSSETVVMEPSNSSSAELQSQPPQKAVHPSLKKLLGKTTIDYNEILKIRPARQAAKDAKTSIADKLRSKKDERRLRMAPTETVTNHSLFPSTSSLSSACSSTETLKVPRYISPTKIDRKIDKINVARGRNQTRHLIAVGNTSKYIGDDSSQQGVTHKWLVYVRTKTDEASVEEIVAKVRFFLHPSYKPNDVVEVDSSPFQISRRGWGEFPIRVQLYFHPHVQQKPLQIFHNLVLDKKLTGLQTMGAETVVEMWLKLPSPKPPKPLPPPQSPQRPAADGQITPNRKMGTPKKMSTPGRPVECATTMTIVHCMKNDEPAQETPDEPPAIWDHESVISDDFKSPKPIIPVAEQCNGVVTGQKDVSNSHTVTIKFESNTPPALMTPPATPSVPIPTTPIIPMSNPKTATPTVTPPSQPRKLMKCLDSNGKVILVEIQVDPNNPKSFKIIKNANQTPIKINNPIGPTLPLTKANTPHVIRIASTQPQLNGIKAIPPGRLIVLPKSSLINNNHNNNGSTSKSTTTILNPTNASPRLIQQIKPIQIPPQQQLQRLPNQTIRPIFKSSNPTITKTQLPSGLIKPNNVIMRNGKVFIIDPTKVIAKSVLSPQVSNPLKPTTSFSAPKSLFPSASTSSNKPKQQSLLKPQISLLKPRPGVVPPKQHQSALRLKTNLHPQQRFLPAHQSTTTTTTTTPHHHQRLQMLQRRSLINGGGVHHPPIGRLMRLPNVILPPEKSVFNTSGGNRIILQPPKRDYRRELEHQFLRRRHFDNRRTAVEFLLRQVPLVHRLAAEHSHPEFRQAFPFAGGSTAAFERMLVPKQRSVEWTRANFIGRLLHKHPELRSLPAWTTKDIILFARKFGFTPQAVLQCSSTPDRPSANSTNPTDVSSTTLSTLIKKEMKREQSLHETLTVSQRIVDWLNEWNKKRLNRRLLADDGLVINVDDDDDGMEAKEKIRNKIKDVSQVKSHRPIAWLPLDTQLRAENALVTEVCNSMQIKLPPEEVVQGVLHNSAQLVMVTALQSFVSDLLRRAYGARKDPDDDNSSPSSVTVDDLRSCLATTSRFDFLTNRYLGAINQSTTEVKSEPPTS